MCKISNLINMCDHVVIIIETFKDLNKFSISSFIKSLQFIRMLFEMNRYNELRIKFSFISNVFIITIFIVYTFMIIA